MKGTVTLLEYKKSGHTSATVIAEPESYSLDFYSISDTEMDLDVTMNHPLGSLKSSTTVEKLPMTHEVIMRITLELRKQALVSLLSPDLLHYAEKYAKLTQEDLDKEEE